MGMISDGLDFIDEVGVDWLLRMNDERMDDRLVTLLDDVLFLALGLALLLWLLLLLLLSSSELDFFFVAGSAASFSLGMMMDGLDEFFSWA